MRLFKKILLFIIIFLGASIFITSSSWALEPAQITGDSSDGYIHYKGWIYYPPPEVEDFSVNTGSNTLQVYYEWGTDGEIDWWDEYRSYLRFPLAGLPSGWEVETATLYLYPTAYNGQTTVVDHIANYEALDTGDWDITQYSPAFATPLWVAGIWNPINVTNQIRDDFSMGRTYSSYRLRQTISSIGLYSYFNTSESANKPYLLVTYKLTKPTGVTATADSSSAITVSWNSNLAADHYHVYRSSSSGVLGSLVGDNITTTSFQDTGLLPNKQYFYIVKTVNSDMESEASTQVSRYTLANIPANLSATAISANQINLNWDANDNPFSTDYELLQVGLLPPVIYDQTDSAVTYSGLWSTGTDASHYGGTHSYSNATGSSATFSFTGTSVSWLAAEYTNRGIAKVYLDDVYQQDVNLYSPSWQAQQRVYSKTGLSNTSHTLKVEVKGVAGAGGGTYISVDAFEAGTVPTRVEDTNSAISWNPSIGTDDTLTWKRYVGGSYSGGGTTYTKKAGATAIYSFNGSSITWLAAKASNRGIAGVYIDGEYDTDVDLYADPIFYPTGSYQPVYTRSGLSDGAHTIKIEVTNTKNPASSNYYVDIDAFDVVGAIYVGTDTSYSHKELSPNTQYTYKVRAKNGEGVYTDYTSPVSRYTWANPPTNAEAIAGYNTTDGYYIDVSWSSGGVQDHYRVYSSSDNYATVKYDGTATTYRETGLGSNTTYTYRIYAVNGDDVENPTYIESNAEPTSAIPRRLNVIAGSSPNIDLTWRAPPEGADHYIVYRDYSRITDENKAQARILARSVDTTNYTDSTGIPGETYYYQITAVNASGEESLVSVRVIQDYATVAGKELPHGGYSILSNLCRVCHEVHLAKGTKKIFRKTSNIEICYACHDGTGSDFNIRDGFEHIEGTKEGSAHDRYLQASEDTGIKCTRCHHPHGAVDYPGGGEKMTLKPKENLCYKCHDNLNNSVNSINIKERFSASFDPLARHDIFSQAITSTEVLLDDFDTLSSGWVQTSEGGAGGSSGVSNQFYGSSDSWLYPYSYGTPSGSGWYGTSVTKTLDSPLSGDFSIQLRNVIAAYVYANIYGNVPEDPTIYPPITDADKTYTRFIIDLQDASGESLYRWYVYYGLQGIITPLSHQGVSSGTSYWQVGGSTVREEQATNLPSPINYTNVHANLEFKKVGSYVSFIREELSGIPMEVKRVEALPQAVAKIKVTFLQHTDSTGNRVLMNQLSKVKVVESILSDSAANANRIECVSCHNPHLNRRDDTDPADTLEQVINPYNKWELFTGKMVGFCNNCHDNSPPWSEKTPVFEDDFGTLSPDWVQEKVKEPNNTVLKADGDLYADFGAVFTGEDWYDYRGAQVTKTLTSPLSGDFEVSLEGLYYFSSWDYGVPSGIFTFQLLNSSGNVLYEVVLPKNYLFFPGKVKFKKIGSTIDYWFDNYLWERSSASAAAVAKIRIALLRSYPTSLQLNPVLEVGRVTVDTSERELELRDIFTTYSSDYHGERAGSDRHGGHPRPSTGALKPPFYRDYSAVPCTECHDTHGTENVYHLKEKVNNQVITPPIADSQGYGAERFCTACHQGGVNDFHRVCLDCHQTAWDLVAQGGEASGMFENSGGYPPLTFEGAPCFTCHKHGGRKFDATCSRCHGVEGFPYSGQEHLYLHTF